MIDLNNIFEKYLVATGHDPNSNSIRLGVDSDWTCKKATRRLKDDPTGVLSLLTMRQAYKEYIENTKFSIQDFINGKVDINNIDNLKYALFEDQTVKDVYDKFESILKNILNMLDISDHGKYLSNPRIEEIMSDAIEDFNQPFKLKHERFTNNEFIPSNNAKLSPTLHKYSHYRDFIDALKNTKDDNFICFAYIDRTFESCEDDYDKYYDKFFAIGLKNNGAVVSISDRTVRRSPEDYFKHRNPSRDYNDKLKFSWLPYSINSKTDIPSLPLLSAGSEDSNILNYFDDIGVIYLSTLLALTYKKYFIDGGDCELKRSYFGSEVKLLPAITSRALIAAGDYVEVKSFNNNIKAESYVGSDNIHNTGFWDYYIDEYPTPNDHANLPIIKDFIGSAEDAEKLSWWLTRKAQYNHINSKLKENYKNREAALIEWLKSNIDTNKQSILEFLLSHKPINKAYDRSGEIWEIIKDRNEFDAYHIEHSQIGYFKDAPIRHYNVVSTTKGELIYDKIGTYTNLYFKDDNNRRNIEVKITLRSYTDFIKFFKIKNSDLPKEFKRHFYARLDSFTVMGYRPYTGNSILNFEDPLVDIDDPYDKIPACICVYMSKSKYNKIFKGIVEKCDLNLYD